MIDLNKYKDNEEFTTAISILKKIETLGYEALIVGGFIRDLLNGVVGNDIDVSTNCPMNIIEQEFSTFDIGKNKAFGVEVVKVNGYTFEIANYRTDIYSNVLGNGADKVEIANSFKEDSARRDFTINSLGMNSEGTIVDYHNGITHLQEKIICTVGNPEDRFSEDYIRMLRGIRFAVKMDCSIDVNTFNAIKNNAHKIVYIASERIYKELYKILSLDGKKVSKAIQLLDESGLLKFILPEIVELKKMKHSITHHPEGNQTVYGHIIACLEENTLSDPFINMSIICHDLGKLDTYEFEDDKHSYHGHAKSGIKFIDSICDRLKIDNDMRECLNFVAEYHMQVWEFPKMSNNNVYKVINNKWFDKLLKVAYCDSSCRMHVHNEGEWIEVQEKVKSVKEKFVNNEFISSIKKVVNGYVVMDLLHLTEKDGKEIGRVIKNTIQWIVDNNINLLDIDLIKDYIIKENGK